MKTLVITCMFANVVTEALQHVTIYNVLLVAFVSIIVVVCPLILLIKSEMRKSVQAKIDRRHAIAFKKWHNAVVRTGVLEPQMCALILDKDEECLWVEFKVTLYEVRPINHAKHTFGSIPLGNDEIRIGQAFSISESTDEWRPISVGQLYVTNKQIYFDGDKFNRTIPISQIATIKADWSAIEINSKMHQNSMVFFGVNGNIIRESVLCATGQEVFSNLLT